jgi:hypothetical protein
MFLAMVADLERSHKETPKLLLLPRFGILVSRGCCHARVSILQPCPSRARRLSRCDCDLARSLCAATKHKPRARAVATRAHAAYRFLLLLPAGHGSARPRRRAPGLRRCALANPRAIATANTHRNAAHHLHPSPSRIVVVVVSLLWGQVARG